MVFVRGTTLAAVMLALAVSACGGDSAGGSGTGTTYTVGGTVTGLVGTGLVLTNSGTDDRAIAANGAFKFANSIANAAAYSVTVKNHPSGQTCSVANGSGVIASADVTNVQVTCTTQSSPSLVGSWSTTGLGAIPGTVVLSFAANGDYSVDAASTTAVDVTGTYQLGAAGTITFADTGGPQACAATVQGTYGYAISGSTLTFTLTSDTCAGRMTAMAKTWTRQ